MELINYKGHSITPELLAEFRDWIIECAQCGVFRDLEADEAKEYINSLTAEQVCKAVNRHFAGGIEEAIICCTPFKI